MDAEHSDECVHVELEVYLDTPEVLASDVFEARADELYKNIFKTLWIK